jgi:hypothetical protein
MRTTLKITVVLTLAALVGMQTKLALGNGPHQGGGHNKAGSKATNHSKAAANKSKTTPAGKKAAQIGSHHHSPRNVVVHTVGHKGGVRVNVRLAGIGGRWWSRGLTGVAADAVAGVPAVREGVVLAETAEANQDQDEE